MASDWIFSSRPWTDETPTIDGSPVAVSAPLDFLYLVHTDNQLDLLARVSIAMFNAGVAAPSVFITEDRHVRLESSGTFTVVWGAATILRNLLGFTGDLAAATGYTAPLYSPLLWSPGKTMTPNLSPLDTHGQPVADITTTFGPQGRQAVREEGNPTVRQHFTAQHVELARWHEPRPTAAAGSWASFWDTEIRTRKLVVLREVTEGLSNTVSAGYGSSIQLGPYFADMSKAPNRTLTFARAAGFGRVEKFYNWGLSVVQTPEYS